MFGMNSEIQILSPLCRYGVLIRNDAKIESATFAVYRCIEMRLFHKVFHENIRN